MNSAAWFLRPVTATPAALAGPARAAFAGRQSPPAGRRLRIIAFVRPRPTLSMSRPLSRPLPRPLTAAAARPSGRAARVRAEMIAGSGSGAAVAADAANMLRSERDQRFATWLAAAARGDHAAFEAFYDATFAYARTVARRLLRDPAEVEDLLADAYFEAWRTLSRFDAARGSAVTWLLTLVRSRALDALRAAAARPDRNAPVNLANEAADRAAIDEPQAAADADPSEQLWRRQSGAALHAALAALSAPERWVLGLAYLRELSHAEIARCTGMPLGTVKSHALRAQNKLRALLARGPLGQGAAATPDTAS
jgi:RNA polymerase sigma-70 factor, ECF subfamily